MSEHSNSKYTNIKVLIADGRARQSLPLIRAFRNLGCEVSALCASKLDVAYASRYTNYKLIGVCDNAREQETVSQIRSILECRKFDIVVPTSDFSARILSKNKIEFSRYAAVASNDYDVFEKAADKLQTMKICMEQGIPCPYTLTGAQNVETVLSSEIQFPIVVKPRIGYGAIGFRKINNVDELKALFLELGEFASDFVFQEYIPQTDIQYECAMFIDNNNRAKTSLVFSKNRWFPVNGGSSTLNITVDRSDIVKSCSRLLQGINWRGAADIDLIQDPRDGVAKVMEINPRVSGSVKIAFDAGVDQARQMLELSLGDEVTYYNRYEVGRRLRCSQSDLMWFLKSPNRFKAKPSWFSLYKTHDQIFTWSDPWPWFTFSLHCIKDYRKEMKKRVQ